MKLDKKTRRRIRQAKATRAARQELEAKRRRRIIATLAAVIR
jgi:hypothetical protein